MIPADIRKAWLIVNPEARHCRSAHLMERVIRILQTVFPISAIHRTDHPGHALELARDAVQQDCPLVIAAGGDGTIHEVANALVGTRTALAFLPMGTANTLAREIGLPINPEKACFALGDGTILAVYPGKAGARYFLVVAGIGLDAHIVDRVESRLKAFKRRGGIAAYLLAGLTFALTYRYPEIRLDIDGRRFSATSVLIPRVSRYGGPFRISPGLDLLTPRFEVLLFQKKNPFLFLLSALTLLCRSTWKPYGIQCLIAQRIRIEGHPAVLLQADGELVRPLPRDITISAQPLRLLVPSAGSDAPTG